MPEQINKVYKFAALSEYTFKERILIRLADLVFSGFIKILGSLSRFEVRGMANFEAVAAAGKLPIYTFWHDRIILSAYFWRDRGIVILTSKSFDGEYIARALQRFGCGVIRGSSSRGAVRALVEMVKSMRSGLPMAFAVDGPRGPRYEVKPGPVMLAKKTGNPILPFVIEPRKFWTIKSWDKLQIPRPFSRSLVMIGEPIYVGSADDNEAKLAQFQRSLDELVAEGKRWSGQTN